MSRRSDRPSTSAAPRLELRVGGQALVTTTCAACCGPLGPAPARPILVDGDGDSFGAICGWCLTLPADELGARFGQAAEDHLALAAAFQALADRAGQSTLWRPTLLEWLEVNQRAERDLLDGEFGND